MPRILLADDAEEFRDVIREALEAEGYEVVVAEDGQHALELFRTAGPFDFLLFDHDMPRVTGRDAIANLRSRGVRTPGLILTGSPLLTQEQLRGLDVTLLRKPVSIDVLIAEIRRALGASP
jgi:CheY-like chemotaxis protein